MKKKKLKIKVKLLMCDIINLRKEVEFYQKELYKKIKDNHSNHQYSIGLRYEKEKITLSNSKVCSNCKWSETYNPVCLKCDPRGKCLEWVEK